jgi:hypothetical protein
VTVSGPPDIRISVEVTAAGAAPTGRIVDGDGAERRFAGWMELVAALEAARGDLSVTQRQIEQRGAR